jgi:16S rRNA (guanine527-N7)-methyltransferase
VFSELLRSRLRGIVSLTPVQIQALQSHYELLLRWNQVLNLTAIRSVEEIVERHYGEALFLAADLPQVPLRIADIGSGAGFPGIPVAIFRPDCRVTLIESHRRKAVFLKEAVRQLPNVRVLGMRAEDITESFQCAISRAVSYEDLVPVLHKLARTAKLLTGAEHPPPELCFTWNSAIALPWGRARFLRSGSQ